MAGGLLRKLQVLAASLLDNLYSGTKHFPFFLTKAFPHYSLTLCPLVLIQTQYTNFSQNIITLYFHYNFLAWKSKSDMMMPSSLSLELMSTMLLAELWHMLRLIGRWMLPLEHRSISWLITQFKQSVEHMWLQLTCKFIPLDQTYCYVKNKNSVWNE